MGPVLFIIFVNVVNDIDINIASRVLKFPDDAKLVRRVATTEAFTLQHIQEDLHKMYEWSKDWQMLFNAEKCKVLHLGRENRKYDYYLAEGLISETEEEKDLGVLINKNLSPSSHIAKVVKKANSVLGIIRRTYLDKSKNTILPHNKSLVRPHHDYCVQAWGPYLQQDVDNLEQVQRHATKMIWGLQDLPYEEKLKRTNLMSLEIRRYRADLLEVYRIMHGLDKLKPEALFDMAQNSLRGHNFTIKKQRQNLMLLRYAFSQRVVDHWNKLPGATVNA